MLSYTARMGRTSALTELPNIGAKLAGMLEDAGVRNRSDIRRIGAPALYRRLQATSPRKLPVCYYLYSLEGAVQGRHWNDFTETEKRKLRLAAGLKD